MSFSPDQVNIRIMYFLDALWTPKRLLFQCPVVRAYLITWALGRMVAAGFEWELDNFARNLLYATIVFALIFYALRFIVRIFARTVLSFCFLCLKLMFVGVFFASWIAFRLTELLHTVNLGALELMAMLKYRQIRISSLEVSSTLMTKMGDLMILWLATSTFVVLHHICPRTPSSQPTQATKPGLAPPIVQATSGYRYGVEDICPCWTKCTNIPTTRARVRTGLFEGDLSPVKYTSNKSSRSVHFASEPVVFGGDRNERYQSPEENPLYSRYNLRRKYGCK